MPEFVYIFCLLFPPGAELMKGEEGTERVICIKNEDGIFVEEIVKLNDCGGLGCCRFEFKDAPAEE